MKRKLIEVRALRGTDQIGKVFIVVAQHVHKCLVCEEFFTPLGSVKHAKVACPNKFTNKA